MAKVAAKKPKDNTTISAQSKEKVEKECTPYSYDSYFSMKDFRTHPVSDRFKKELAMKMVEWAQKDDSRILTKFYNQENIRDTTVQKWTETNEDLKQAHAFAKQVIAGRLLDGGLTRTYSESLIKWIMPVYSSEMKALEEWRAKLGEKVDGATQINVTMTPFPSSPKVKGLKDGNRSE